MSVALIRVMVDANIIWVVGGLIALGLAVIVVSLAFARRARERSTELRARFGPEYDRTVDQLGERSAQTQLAARARRVGTRWRWLLARHRRL